MPKYEQTIDVEIPEKTCAVEVARRMELRDIRLVQLRAVQNFKTRRIPKYLIEFQIKIQSRLTLENESRLLFILVAFNVKAKDAADDAQALEIDAPYEVIYSVKDQEPITEEQHLAFGFHFAVDTAWPYLRRLLLALSTELSIPPVRLPLTCPVEKAEPIAEGVPSDQ